MIKRINVWAWPVVCGLILAIGFSLRGSDTPANSLALMSLVSLVASISWAKSFAERPPLKARRELISVLIASFALVLYLFAQPYAINMTHSWSAAQGLYDPSRANWEYLKLAGIACAFAFGFRISENDESARRVVDAIIFVGTAWAVIAIALNISDPDGIYGELKTAGRGRLTGAFSSANSAATLFGAIALLALGRLIDQFWKIRARSWLERINPFFLVAVVLLFAAEILTLSRTGISATVIMSFLLILFLCWRRTSVKWLVICTSVACIGFIAALLSPLAQLLDRAQDINSAGQVRAQIFVTHFNVAIHEPLLGSGLGSFNAVNKSILSEETYKELSIIQAAHNVYLQWFEECGVIGLLAIIAINVAILWIIVTGARQRSTMGARLWSILAGYSVFLIHGLTDYAFQEPVLEIFVAVLLGCGVAISTNSGRVVR